MAVQGYNIAFRLKVGNDYLTIAGRTQDDLTIAARTRERLTKDDEGETQVSVKGQDITFRATALVDIDSETAITRDALIADALATSSSAVFDFQYEASGGYLMAGKCVITNYSESSNASDEATLTVDFRVTGNVTFAAPVTEEVSPATEVSEVTETSNP